MSNTAPKTRAIIEDPKVIRQAVQDKVLQALRKKFPIEARNYRVELANLEVQSTPQSPQQQKLTLLGKGNVSDTVYADLKVSDVSTGKKLMDIKHHRIMNYPRFTNRYTMMVDGNEYNIVNQLRTKSGVYTRTRGNGELESSFNLESGANFKLVMNPETGVFKVDILHSVIPVAALLKILNCPPSAAEKALGPELYAVNREATPAQFNRAVNTLYDKLVKYKSALEETATTQEKIRGIRQYFAGTRIDGETTRITLGREHTSVGYQTILDAAAKVVRVHKGEESQDARDNLEFQKVFSVEDFLGEALEKSTTEVTKIKNKLGAFKPSGDPIQDRKAIKAIFSPMYFSRPVRNFVTTSSISRLPSQINPMEIMDGATIVTRLGEGAISSEQAVPDETRDVNHSYLGTIDPIATPESGKIGIDNRFSIGAIKGEDNELYKRVINTRTGKGEVKRIIDLRDKTLGFPDPPHKKKLSPEDQVPAVHKGELVHVKRSELDYQIPTVHDISTVTTNTLPFVNANQGNRVVMGAKHVQQALPLKDRDKRLVEAIMPSLNQKVSKTLNDSTLGTIGGYLIPRAPIDGVVTRISDSTIRIRGNDGKTEEVYYDNHLPLASKTMLNNTLLIKPGDTVKKGQALAESNFTKDGTLALGKNLDVAYMPYHGQNHEDGIVISEGAAKKLTSMHAEKVTIPLDKLSVLDKETFSTYFPTLFSKDQLSKLDSDGVVRKGEVLESGDPLAVVLENAGDSKRNQVLGKLHKALISKYRDVSQVYEQAYPATVVDVVKTRKLVTILLEMEKPAAPGDKLSGSYGNKGVITKIIPDDQMVQNAEGKPLDAVFTSAGVIGRINPAQTLESALGKVAKKTGKSYRIENYGYDDYTKFVDGELKKHNVSDKETLFDPVTGKEIPKVFTGVQHIHKLFKTTDSNFAGRGVDGPHDQDDTPTGSGATGPKALGGMEVNALIAHGARNLLRESTMLRASKNRDFWQAFQEGRIAHPPQEKKSFTKLVGLLRQAGIKVDKKGDDLVAGPLTDKDALAMSNGEITEATELAAKNMLPEKGGLFDERITGGLDGDKWTHVTLAEPVLNPIFEDGAKALLGVSTKDLHSMYKEKGGDFVRRRLNSIDLKKELKDTRKSLDDPRIKGDVLDNRVKKLKYLRALDDRGLKAGDAYTLQHVPVLPPKLRPITVGKTGDIMSNDANSLYKDLIAQNSAFKKIRQAGMEELLPENREAIYSRVRELTGVMAPGSAQHKAKGTKGAVQFVSGDVPKHGYFQRKVVYSKMNMSGRATIAPDNTLGLDEIGVPVDMAWSMYGPFVIRKLVQLGHTAVSAKEAVAERSDLATKILHEELEKRPMITNRAPTLWKHSLLGVKPVLRTGKNLMVNSLWESSTNADYDGDAMQVHVPITEEAIEDVKKIMPSKLIYSDKKKGDLLVMPSHEPIVGLYKVTRNVGMHERKPVHRFSSVDEAWKAYYAGKLKATDYVDIQGG